jgi:alanine racemase
VTAPSRLAIDGGALVANWRALARASGGAACGAAVKADGYGLGAREVVTRLAAAGCRDVFVATWAEAAAIAGLVENVSVLHGVRAEDLERIGLPGVRPVLNTDRQIARWREAGGGSCDVMVDTGMNRLGIAPEDVAGGLLDGLRIETLMSHLACADAESAMNPAQATALRALAGRTSARRLSLANSAGIALGADYAFDLTRPGLALYGGIPRREFSGVIAQVVAPEAQVLQRRRVAAGGSVGYGATWAATADTEVAIVNLGYADGYWRGFSGAGGASAGGARLPVLGRVSMDLTALNVGAAPGLVEGDWVRFDYDLPGASAVSGMSQYELLTGLGPRFERAWQ